MPEKKVKYEERWFTHFEVLPWVRNGFNGFHLCPLAFSFFRGGEDKGMHMGWMVILTLFNFDFIVERRRTFDEVPV